MTDINQRIDAHLSSDDAEQRWLGSDNLLEDASQEIERLNKALKWEQDRSGRVGTHSPGCWSWGHQHYRCAMEHIAGLDKELESAALIVGEVRKEMVEMNERIRQLRVEAGYD